MSYYALLEEVREFIPAGRVLDFEYALSGNIPQGLAARLPILPVLEDNSKSVQPASFRLIKRLNSGGRGLLIQDGGRTYRLKGVDPFSSMTDWLALQSKKQVLIDVYLAYVFREKNQLSVDETKGRIRLPTYRTGPVGMITHDGAANEERALEALAAYFKKQGFRSPLQYIGKITNKQFLWNGEYAVTGIFELPNPESDLRKVELESLFYRHVRHATKEQLQELVEPMRQFYEKVLGWYAFTFRSLADNNLLVTPNSILGQNFVMGTMGDGIMGVTRVDHTSTKKIPSGGEKKLAKTYQEYWSQAAGFFYTLMLAVECGDRGDDVPRGYTGLFDFVREMDNLPLSDPLQEALTSHQQMFMLQWERNEPTPITEKELNGLWDMISRIPRNLDGERQAWQRRIPRDSEVVARFRNNPPDELDSIMEVAGSLYDRHFMTCDYKAMGGKRK